VSLYSDETWTVPGGTFISGPSEDRVAHDGAYQNVNDFGRIILAYRDGSAITFSDIGRAVDTIEEPRSLARLDGRPAISLLIRKQSGTNTVRIIDTVKAKLAEISRSLPPDLNAAVIRDQSTFIEGSVNAIYEHLLLGGLSARKGVRQTRTVMVLMIRNGVPV
jgi:HAE1 family hydrophobic/amphiphilic exporter-1